MSFERPGLLALRVGLVVGLLGTVASGARAGELDRCYAEMHKPAASAPTEARAADLDRTTQADLKPIEDFHPETDRWTERTNRIRITPWIAAWFFSGELNVQPDVAIGVRISWEVPGFIGIRLDSGVVPWSNLEVKGARAANPNSVRYATGVVHSHTLSIGIFNPELSIDGLAFWAGFGGGLWFFDYHEADIFGNGSGIDADFTQTTFGANIFLELDYKITDIIHVGTGLREHVLFASFTDDGRFYEFNGVKQGSSGRNNGILDDLAVVTEWTVTLSILF
jgi:hypothetical protein